MTQPSEQPSASLKSVTMREGFSDILEDPPAQRRLDRARLYIAAALVALLVVLAIVPLAVFVWVLPEAEQTQSGLEGLLAIIFGPVTTLVGAAVGFYFGSGDQASN